MINWDDIPHGVDKFMKEIDFNKHGKKKNTSLVYGPKIVEFKQYCNKVFGGRDVSTQYVVDQINVYRFFLYVAFREQKKRGRRKWGEVKEPTFDVDKWNCIAITMKRPTTGELQSLQLATTGELHRTFYALLEPEKGVGFSTIATTKAAIKKCWLSKVKDTPNVNIENQIFSCTFQKLMEVVQERKPRQDQRNFVEKIDKDSTPMESVTCI